MLEVLERGNLFVVPLDDKRHWFRYHHLFRELLLDHLPELKSPDHRAAVARRAETEA